MPPTTTADGPKLLNQSQVARLYGVSRNTVACWIDAGLPTITPPGLTSPRIRREDVDPWLAAHAESGAS
jgi:excisionase family DNA binding protein